MFLFSGWFYTLIFKQQNLPANNTKTDDMLAQQIKICERTNSPTHITAGLRYTQIL
jgi:hypothetical protein